METERIDKWLWVARFFKTRALAQEQIGKGRVQILAASVWQEAKAGRVVHVGEQLRIQTPQGIREIHVLSLSKQRGSAEIAQAMYEESAESIARREKEQTLRKLNPSPGSLAGWHDGKGRPTKKDRRELENIKLRLRGSKFDW